MDKEKIGYAILFLLMLGLAIAPILAVKYPPLYDYPDHLLIMHILGHLNDPHYAPFFSLDFKFYPNMMIYALGALLNQFLDIYLVGKLILSFLIIFFVSSCFFLFYSIDQKKWWLGFISFTLVYNIFFVFGFMNFILGISLFNVLIGIYFKYSKKKSLQYLNGILFLLIYFTHSLSFIASLGTILFLSYYSNKNLKKSIEELIPAIPSVIIGLIYLTQIASPSLISDYAIYVEYQTTFLFNLKYIFFPFVPFTTVFENIVILELAFVLILLSYLTIKNKQQDKRFAYLSLAFLVMFIILPFHTKNAGFVNYRMLLFAAVTYLVSLATPNQKLLRETFIVMIVLIFIAQIILVNTHFHDLSDQIQKYNEGIPIIAENSSILPLFEYPDKYYNRMEHSDAYYVLERGGYSPTIFTYKEYDLLRLKKPLPTPDGYFIEFFDVNKFNQYQYIIYWGKDDTNTLKESYNLEFDNNIIKIYKKIN